MVPPGHRSVSLGLEEGLVVEFQTLLNEALADQRLAHKQRLITWLAEPDRFRKTKRGFRMTLARDDSEWLLQVLNDIRVGHWLLLGSPDSAVTGPPTLELEMVRSWMFSCPNVVSTPSSAAT